MPVSRTSRTRALAGDLAAAAIAPSLALAGAELIHSGLGITRLGLIFLAAVTVAASIRGGRAALFTALISVVAYKYFIDWRTNDSTTTIEDLLNLAVFLIVALITGVLAGKIHDEAAKAHRQAERMEQLFKTSRILSEEAEEGFWPALTDAVAYGAESPVLALDSGGAICAQSGELGNTDEALQFGIEALGSSGTGESERDQRWRARTIPTEKPYAGVLVWESRESGDGTDGFVDLIVELASASCVRTRARQEQVRMEAAEEASKLREALLSSISHDFRSPLAAIIGSSTSLLEYGDKFEPAVRTDLLLNIRDEGERLNHFVANLLNMTRLRAGVVNPSRQSLNVGEVVGTVIERLKRHHGKAPRISVNADCQIEADPLLLEQAIYNVVDNAAKYADSHDGIHISCANEGRTSRILIADRGPGLPKDDQANVFNSFHYSQKNGQPKGTGLGLSISRGFVEAMGGTIEARDRSDRRNGLEITITLPGSAA